MSLAIRAITSLSTHQLQHAAEDYIGNEEEYRVTGCCLLHNQAIYTVYALNYITLKLS